MTGILKRFCFGLLFILSVTCFSAEFPKSYFVDRLTTVWITDKVLVTLAPLGYQSASIGYVEVPAGFYTDLASVMRIPVLYDLLGNRAPGPAVLHDYLYRFDSIPVVPRDVADQVFLEAMESRGVAWWIRWPMYLGVCAGGGFSYHKKFVNAQLF